MGDPRKKGATLTPITRLTEHTISRVVVPKVSVLRGTGATESAGKVCERPFLIGVTYARSLILPINSRPKVSRSILVPNFTRT